MKKLKLSVETGQVQNYESDMRLVESEMSGRK